MPKTYEYKWYYTRDDAEYYGPFETKEEAIAQLDEDGGFVALCKKQPFDLTLDGHSILSILEDSNEELIGNGDFIDYTPAQIADLEKILEQAIQSWVDVHNLDIDAWHFGDIKDREEIFPSKK